MGPRALRSLILLAPLLSSCSGILGGAEEADAEQRSGDSDGAKNGYQPGDEPLELPKHRVWRLTPLQYERSFVAAFGSTVKTAKDFPRDPRRHGFDDLAPQNHVDIRWSETVQQNAAEVAAVLAEDLVARESCFSEEPVPRDCVEHPVETYGARAYRRPLSAAETTALVDVFEAVRGEGTSVAEALAAVFEAIAQSPYFLYRIEVGQETPDTGVQQLDPYTVASQLSYMFTDAPPDEALLEAAATGALADREIVLEHARRLLNRPEALAKVQRFFDQYLGTHALREEPLPKDADVYPEFSAEIQAAMVRETDRFVERIVFTESGSLNDVFSSTQTFVDDPLRAFYGWEGAADPDVAFPIPAGQRAGVFLQAGTLAAWSPSVKTDPLHRGLYIYERLLCQHVAPPAGVDIFELADQLEPPDPSFTERERLDYLVQQHPSCGNCHSTFVSLGLSLETFDAVGTYRETHNDRPIDPSGVLQLREEESSPYAGAPELFQKIAGSAQGQACFAQNWVTFAFGDEFGVPLTAGLVADFRGSELRILDLLLQVTQQDAFYRRRVEEEQ